MPKLKSGKPEKKLSNELFEAIAAALKSKNYYFTDHALKRSKQRKNVSEFQIIELLESRSKYHESKKDSFDENFRNWNYSIRGKSIDAEDIRIILSFDKDLMLVITVINLNK